MTPIPADTGTAATSGPTTAPVRGSLVARADLDADARAGMYALLDQHFAGVTADRFAADLSDKNWVLLLHRARPGGRDGPLVGFSTMRVYETRAAGPLVTVLCSGDTIVDPSAWGAAALPREWIAAVGALRGRFPRGPLHWLLITSGFRTYRLLSTFWQAFHPRYDDAPTSTDARRTLDALARERFGGAYDPATGLVRLPHPQALRPHLAGVPPERRADPHVAYFLARNPGHAAGDELACLCDLSPANLTRAGRRVTYGHAGFALHGGHQRGRADVTRR